MRSDVHIVSSEGRRAYLAIDGARIAVVAPRESEIRSGVFTIERVDTEVKPN